MLYEFTYCTVCRMRIPDPLEAYGGAKASPCPNCGAVTRKTIQFGATRHYRESVAVTATGTVHITDEVVTVLTASEEETAQPVRPAHREGLASKQPPPPGQVDFIVGHGPGTGTRYILRRDANGSEQVRRLDNSDDVQNVIKEWLEERPPIPEPPEAN